MSVSVFLPMAMLGSGYSPALLCGSVVPQRKESCGRSELVWERSLRSARTFVLWTSLGAQHSGQLAKCICQGRGCLATQKLLVTQKHAEALPTMKGQGRKPRPTAWRNGAAPTGTAVVRGPQKEDSVPLPAVPGAAGAKYSRELCGRTEPRVQVPTDPPVPLPRNFGSHHLPVG